MRKLYEDFHKKTKIQTKVISIRNFTYRLHIKVIENYLKKNYSILDVGCGSGVISFYLGNKGFSVLGIDVSKRAIEECKKSSRVLNLNKCKFNSIDFLKLSSTKQFDLILAFEVIEHLRDDSLALKKICKILKKKGFVILSVPSKNAPLFKLGMLAKFDKKVGHLRRYNQEDIERIAKENDLRIIQLIRTEGILRNFLFTNDKAGKMIRFLKGPLSSLFTFIDSNMLDLFGESNIIVVLKKIL